MIPCDRSPGCAASYCDKECADAHWKSRHANDCGDSEGYDADCPICFEVMDPPFEFPMCGHCTCHACLVNTLKKAKEAHGNGDSDAPTHDSCPMCR